MCCRSKPKPVDTSAKRKNQETGLNSKHASLTSNGKQVGNSKLTGSPGQLTSIPKSTITFSAYDFESAPLNKQLPYITTKKINHYVSDRGDRKQDYAQQLNQANQSKLIEPNSLLSYQLDHQDGISSVPVINTFHYESALNHFFLQNYHKQQIKNASNHTSRSAYFNLISSLPTQNVVINKTDSQIL